MNQRGSFIAVLMQTWEFVFTASIAFQTSHCRSLKRVSSISSWVWRNCCFFHPCELQISRLVIWSLRTRIRLPSRETGKIPDLVKLWVWPVSPPPAFFLKVGWQYFTLIYSAVWFFSDAFNLKTRRTISQTCQSVHPSSALHLGCLLVNFQIFRCALTSHQLGGGTVAAEV